MEKPPAYRAILPRAMSNTGPYRYLFFSDHPNEQQTHITITICYLEKTTPAEMHHAADTVADHLHAIAAAHVQPEPQITIIPRLPGPLED